MEVGSRRPALAAVGSESLAGRHPKLAAGRKPLDGSGGRERTPP